jgi:uncharacterized protein YeaO (DUF488 family)
MPVKVGCASDYNKNHPRRKYRDKETVVLVAIRRYDWVDFDEHITQLAPRIPTVVEWKKSKMTTDDWDRFSSKYKMEMKSTKSLKAIKKLWKRSITGEIIRLVCYEKDNDPHCHRYMLKLLIDEFLP